MGKMPEAQNFLIPPRIFNEFKSNKLLAFLLLLSIYLNSSYQKVQVICSCQKFMYRSVKFFTVCQIPILYKILLSLF